MRNACLPTNCRARRRASRSWAHGLLLIHPPSGACVALNLPYLDPDRAVTLVEAIVDRLLATPRSPKDCGSASALGATQDGASVLRGHRARRGPNGPLAGRKETPELRCLLHPKLRTYFENVDDHRATAGLAARRPVGPALRAAIGAALATLATEVAPQIVYRNLGTIIYCGGDDAVARVYRMIEWTAQWLLRTKFGADTADVPADLLPPQVEALSDRAGKVKLGLWDAWQVVGTRIRGPARDLIATTAPSCATCSAPRAATFLGADARLGTGPVPTSSVPSRARPA